MSTHNICFRGEIRKILCGYPLLSVAMQPRSTSLQADVGLHCPLTESVDTAVYVNKQGMPRSDCMDAPPYLDLHYSHMA